MNPLSVLIASIVGLLIFACYMSVLERNDKQEQQQTTQRVCDHYEITRL